MKQNKGNMLPLFNLLAYSLNALRAFESSSNAWQSLYIVCCDKQKAFLK